MVTHFIMPLLYNWDVIPRFECIRYLPPTCYDFENPSSATTNEKPANCQATKTTADCETKSKFVEQAQTKNTKKQHEFNFSSTRATDEDEETEDGGAGGARENHNTSLGGVSSQVTYGEGNPGFGEKRFLGSGTTLFSRMVSRMRRWALVQGIWERGWFRKEERDFFFF